MTIRGILFDKDGTLLDFRRTWVPINREAALFAAAGDTAVAAALLKLGGQDPITNHVESGSVLAAGTHEDVADLFATHLGPKTPNDLADEIERIFRAGGATYSQLIDGASGAVTELRRRGYILGVATNDSAAGLAASLGRHGGFIENFTFTAGCDSGHGAKPGPGMALAFSAALGIAPSEVAVVGDAPHDLEMGRRAGAGLLVGVLGGTSEHSDLARDADVVLDGVALLPGWLATAPAIKSPTARARRPHERR